MKVAAKTTCMLILVCVLGVGATSAAGGEDKVWNTLTADQLAGMMQGWGYRAESKVRDSGRAYISTGSGGTNYTIVFYDLKDDDGTYEDIHMVAWFNDSFEGTMADANNWNLKNRHAYAIYDGSDNTVGLNMDLTLKGGVTATYLEKYIEMWGGYLQKFESYLAQAH